MAFASLESGDENEPLCEINMVPLIDVMLVLLIIFIVTAPLLTHAVKVDLPQAASMPNQTPPQHIQLAIGADARVFWNGEPVAADALEARFAAAAQTQPLPELQLRAERSTPYEQVAQLMSGAARHGLNRIAFVTDPTPPR